MILTKHFKQFDFIRAVEIRNNSYINYISKDLSTIPNVFLVYDVKDTLIAIERKINLTSLLKLKHKDFSDFPELKGF
jgi:predicted ester cyclase